MYEIPNQGPFQNVSELHLITKTDSFSHVCMRRQMKLLAML